MNEPATVITPEQVAAFQTALTALGKEITTWWEKAVPVLVSLGKAIEEAEPDGPPPDLPNWINDFAQELGVE